MISKLRKLVEAILMASKKKSEDDVDIDDQLESVTIQLGCQDASKQPDICKKVLRVT